MRALLLVTFMFISPLLQAAAQVITPYQPTEAEINEFMYRMIRDGLDQPIDQKNSRSLFVCRYERRPGGYSTDLSCGTNKAWNYVRDLMLLGLSSGGYGRQGSGNTDRMDGSDFIFTLRTVSRRKIQDEIDRYSGDDSESENRERLLRLVLLFLVGLEPGTVSASNTDIVSFALAYYAIRQAEEQYDARITEIDDPVQARLLADELESTMISEISAAGLEVDTYNDLVDTLGNEPILLDAVRKATAILGELQWAPD